MAIDQEPWLSIAIVVKDDTTGFRRTCKSLAEQSLTGVQVVVVDSSANPRGICQLLETSNLCADMHYEWSEPEGIFPAMNKALSLVSGTYILYLNAGDEFYGRRTVPKVREALTASEPLWAFGAVEVIEESGNAVITPSWDYMAEKRALFGRGKFPPHQGTFVRVDLVHQIGGFDASYEVSADYTAFLKMSREADPLVLDFVVARFHEGGTSTREWKRTFREFHRARREVFCPRGIAALREFFDTWRHYFAVFLHRTVGARLQ